MDKENIKKMVVDLKKNYVKVFREQEMEYFLKQQKRKEEVIEEADKILELCNELALTGVGHRYFKEMNEDVAAFLNECGVEVSCEYANAYTEQWESVTVSWRH